jgi:hypothetical protein
LTPTDRFVCRFTAEPPQDPLPYGRWAERLREEFLAACLKIDSEGEDLGDPGDIVWHPDRTWDGRTYVPATARTTTGFDLFGYVSFAPGTDEHEPSDFAATVDFTDETAEANPDWKMDINDEVLGGWRGDNGNVAAMTLVWGRPLVHGGAIVTAELADLAVDQCELTEERFTLIAPDSYRGDTLDVKLWDARGDRIAAESLYDDE